MKKFSSKKTPEIFCPLSFPLLYEAANVPIFDKYAGISGLKEFLSFSCQAVEMLDCSTVVSRLSWCDVPVFNNEFDSLEVIPSDGEVIKESEVRLVALGMGHICGLTRYGRIWKFPWMNAFTSGLSTWERTVFCKIAHACKGIAFVDPVETWSEYGEINVEGMKINQFQFIQLTDFCASFCIDKKIPGFIFAAILKNRFFDSSVRPESFNQFFERFSFTLSNYYWR